ncbi:hypothetical protein HDU78_005298 [Chytriomyces hyalinus]|nr:hypothetical protein HDU78_005298 [Chytriomyces hyalinus]
MFEVERKFAALPSVIARALITPQPNVNPRFNSVEHGKTFKIRDTYYDRAPAWPLAKNGFWLRKRNENWNLKMNLKGGGEEKYQNASFAEVYNPRNIKFHIESVLDPLPPSCNEENNFGLDVLCDITTHRSEYLVDKEFNIMIDTTPIGVFGEVELVASEESQVPGLEKKLEEFMDRNCWFFYAVKGPDEKVRGKLDAYFEVFGMGGVLPVKGG